MPLHKKSPHPNAHTHTHISLWFDVNIENDGRIKKQTNRNRNRNETLLKNLTDCTRFVPISAETRKKTIKTTTHTHTHKRKFIHFRFSARFLHHPYFLTYKFELKTFNLLINEVINNFCCWFILCLTVLIYILRCDFPSPRIENTLPLEFPTDEYVYVRAYATVVNSTILSTKLLLLVAHL